MNEGIDLFERSHRLQEELRLTREHYFVDDVLFTTQWWLLIVAFALAYALFVFSVDRRRLLPIAVVGLLVYGIAVTADQIGADFLLWDYPKMLMPWGPRLLVANLIIPVGFMLTYQWFRGWRSYLIAVALLSALYAFAFEPLAQWTGVYAPLAWKPAYSWPIYIAIGAIAKQAADGAERAQAKAVGR